MSITRGFEDELDTMTIKKRTLVGPTYPETEKSFKQWLNCDSLDAKPLFGIYTHVEGNIYNENIDDLPNWPKTERRQINDNVSEIRYNGCNTGCVITRHHATGDDLRGGRKVPTLQTICWSAAMAHHLTSTQKPSTCSSINWWKFCRMEKHVLEVTLPLVKKCPQMLEFMTDGDWGNHNRTALGVTHMVGQVLLRDQHQIVNYIKRLNSVLTVNNMVEKVRIRALYDSDIINNNVWYFCKRMSGVVPNNHEEQSNVVADTYALTSPYPMFTDYVEVMGPPQDELIWRAYHAGASHKKRKIEATGWVANEDDEHPRKYNGHRVEF